MRSLAPLGLMLALLLGVATPQPAAAWDDRRVYYGGYASGDIYVHHHVYAPRRVKNVYHVHRPGPYHVHVVYYDRTPYVWYNARGSAFGPRYYKWRGYYGRW